MAPTYVYSTRPGSTVAHYGDAERAACYLVLVGPFEVSDTLPPGRTMCRRCVRETAERRHATRRRNQRLPHMAEVAAATARHRDAQRDARVVALLKEGLGNRAITRRLRLAPRTVTRYINDGMRRAGAKSHFQWAWLLGTGAPGPTCRAAQAPRRARRRAATSRAPRPPTR